MWYAQIASKSNHTSPHSSGHFAKSPDLVTPTRGEERRERRKLVYGADAFEQPFDFARASLGLATGKPAAARLGGVGSRAVVHSHDSKCEPQHTKLRRNLNHRPVAVNRSTDHSRNGERNDAQLWRGVPGLRGRVRRAAAGCQTLSLITKCQGHFVPLVSVAQAEKVASCNFTIAFYHPVWLNATVKLCLAVVSAQSTKTGVIFCEFLR